MKRTPVVLSLALLGVVVPATSASAAPFAESWSFATPGEADGLAILDVDGDRRLETVVVINGSGGMLDGVGTLMLLDSSGTPIWSLQTGQELAGEPAVADLDGDGFDEIVVCEAAAVSSCLAVDGDGTILWSQGPFYWASMWGMGPEVGDVDGDGALEVVVATWGGKVVAFDAASGAVEWEYDAWAQLGEQFWNHVALGDVDGDGAVEVVASGYQKGLVVILDGTSGALEATSQELFTLYGDSSGAGMSPMLADLDGDGTPEIVTTSYGNEFAVYAHDGSGNLLWRTPIPEGVVFSAAVAGDTDGDGRDEIHVQGCLGTMYTLTGDGTIATTYNLGTDSWFQPIMVTTVMGPVQDVIGASYDALDVAGGMFTFASTNATFWRASAGDIDNDGNLELLVTDWANMRVLALDFGVGGNQTIPSSSLTRDFFLLGELTAMMTDPGLSPEANDKLLDAADKLFEAAEEALVEKLDKSLKKVEKAVKELLKAQDEGASVDAVLEMILAAALQGVEQAIERTAAIMGDDDQLVLDAQADVATALAEAAAGDWRDAFDTLTDVAKDLKDAEYVTPNCSGSYSHPALARQCALVEVLESTLQLSADPALPNNAAEELEEAAEHLEKALEKFVVLDREKIAREIERAAEHLQEAIDQGADPAIVDALRVELVSIMAAVATETVADAEVVLGATNQDVVEAQQLLADAAAHSAAGDYGAALEDYKRAIERLD